MFVTALLVVSTCFATSACEIYYYLKSGRLETESCLMIKLKCVAGQLILDFIIITAFAFTFCRMPFDPNTVGGFTGVFVSGLIFGTNYLIITTTLVSFLLSMALYWRAFSTHYESMFRNMNDLVAAKPADAVTLIRLKARLIEAIDFHNQAKE